MDLELREALALSEDRRGALSHLLPGSEDHDYYRCLAAQHAQQLDEADQIIAAWPQRHGQTQSYTRLRLRQLLCRAVGQPALVANELRDWFRVQHWHEAVAEEIDPTRPTKLAPGMFDGGKLLREAYNADASLQHVTDEGLHELLDYQLDASRRKSLLQRMHHTPHQHLVRNVVEDLTKRGAPAWGDVAIHEQLTLEQLSAIQRLRPDLDGHHGFICAVVRRMRPHHTVDLELDRAARLAHLVRLWELLKDLPAPINSLKAHVLWHLLDTQRRVGAVDQAHVHAYLSLPRNASYVRHEWLRQADHSAVAQLGTDYREVTGLPPAGSDEELVRDLIARDLARAERYAEWLDRTWFDLELAANTLLDGAGDAVRATQVLGPARAAALRDRVELAWTVEVPPWFGATDPVVLDAWVKNVPEVVVKVFRIDPIAYFHHHKKEVNTNLDLDGLAASHEMVIRQPEPPVRRVRRRIELPMCDRAGTYVIDLIGNGMSSRALVTKGRLRHVTRVGAAGHVITILAEDGTPRPDARAYLGEREYKPDEKGAILVPYSTNPGPQKILLVAEDIATVSQVELVRETYHLGMNVLLDREALAPGRTVQAIARLHLMVAGMPASLALLQRPTWSLTVDDRHGVSTTKVMPLELTDDGAATFEFQVPDEAARVFIQVSASAHVRSEQRDQELSDGKAFVIASIHGTNAIEALYLADTAAGWVVSALGKSGEPRASRPITVALVHRWARWQMNAELATDAQGRVELGPLPGVEWISASLAGTTQQWLAGDVGIGATLYVPSGGSVVVAIPPRRTAAELVRRMSLVELRGGLPARHAEVQIEELASALVLKGLSPGDYDLRAPGLHVAITVAAPGPVVTGVTVAPGEVLQTPRAAPALATLASTADGGIALTLAHAGPRTRVHVIATQFASALVDPPVLTPAMTPQRRQDPARGSYYVSGRDIGDEYRYVLERRAQKRYPSLLLDKPSLLLNPWSRRTTTTDVATARGGAAFAASAPATMRSAYGGGGAEARRRQEYGSQDAAAYASYDFLPDAPRVLANLVVDENGALSIPADALGDAVTVTVIVDDPAGVTRRAVQRALQPLVPKDLRLRIALDKDRHATQKRAIRPLRAGETIAIEDLATAKVHLIDSVERAHSYLLALRDDATLREFSWLAKWPTLTEADRREKYSKHACHELHLFLFYKDRPFFDAVVAPALVHKRTKTFLDHWLLGADLSAYLVPTELARLNAVERALLAQRMPAESAIVRILEDQVGTMAPDPSGEAKLIDALLGAAALDGDSEIADAQALAASEFEGSADESTGTHASYDRVIAMSAAPAPAMMAPGAPPPRPAPPAVGRAVAKKAARRERAADMEMDLDDDLGGDMAKREQAAPAHYRTVDKTQEWAEHNWWRRTPQQSGPEMITTNKLWRDVAMHRGGGFLSPWLGLATTSFAEAMCALALIDLPFAAAKHEYVTTGPGMAITVKSNALAGSAQIVDGELVSGGPPLVVGTSYVRTDDRTEWESGEQRDKYVDAFAPGVVYTCLVVLANPSSSRQRVSALVQIPRGSIAVGGAKQTQTIDVLLAPYGTHGHEYSFYFPQPGAWSHFPVHASRGEVIVAAAPPQTLAVATGGNAADPTAWSHVSQRGSLADVVTYLATKNLAAIELAQVAWRLKDRAAYDAILGALEARRIYDGTLWGYSLLHVDGPRIIAWLRGLNGQLLTAGPSLEMIGTDAEDFGTYEHLELAPLVNARAHRLGPKTRILNDGLAAQYERFLNLVAHRPRPLAKDHLAAASYLLAQDRVDAALAELARVGADPQIAERMQLDYLSAYAACIVGDVATARTRAEPWRDMPVNRWRHRFRALLAMLDEVSGAAPVVVDTQSREQRQSEAAAQQPTFELALDRDGILITSQHVAALELRFFEMDVELLFSRQPFVQSDVSRFSFIEPGHRERLVDLAHEVKLPWPAQLRGRHVVVEAVGAGTRKTAVHYANDLVLTLANTQGQIRVARASDRSPLAATYVKVYARKHGGGVTFYKDGYTDLRGWFDYATLSTNELDHVERFSLLISSEVSGASILESPPPAR